MKTDIVVDLSRGDSAKAKVTLDLLKRSFDTEPYTHVIRTNGGANCGHTVYHNNKKIVTHAIPVGVICGITSVIGPGCVVNVKGFLKELEELQSLGIEAARHVKIAWNAHLVTEQHIAEEANESKIGTTRRGIGPAYRDKYARVGKLVETASELKNYLVDFIEEVVRPESIVLGEGAQGIFLDPNIGDYPFVTSSHCTVGAVLINGIPWNTIRKVVGCQKPYETYVGAKKFQPDDEIFKKIQEIGNEVGATTGRARQCNYLHLGELKKAAMVNGITDLIISKMDVLQKLDHWWVRSDNCKINLKTEQIFKDMITNMFPGINVVFSYSPEKI